MHCIVEQVMRTHRVNVHIISENTKLPKEKVVAYPIIRVPRGGGVTVIHQNVPPVGKTELFLLLVGIKSLI